LESDLASDEGLPEDRFAGASDEYDVVEEGEEVELEWERSSVDISSGSEGGVLL
jgi:hypothetical protein